MNRTARPTAVGLAAWRVVAIGLLLLVLVAPLASSISAQDASPFAVPEDRPTVVEPTIAPEIDVADPTVGAEPEATAPTED